MAHISIGVSHHALRIVFTRLRLMPGLLEKGCIERDVNAKMDLVSVGIAVSLNTIPG